MFPVDVAASANYRSPISFGTFRIQPQSDPLAATRKVPILLGLFFVCAATSTAPASECKQQGMRAGTGTVAKQGKHQNEASKIAPHLRKAVGLKRFPTG